MYFCPETLERWRGEGLPDDWEQHNFFGFDPDIYRHPGVDLGWTETPFLPPFEEKILERTGRYDVIQDVSGRIKRIFRDQPTLAMPQYLSHCVASPADWREQVKPRLDPSSPERWVEFEARRPLLQEANQADPLQHWFVQPLFGGYMFLRNCLGPEGLLYALYDMPELVHDMMRQWLYFLDESLSRIQGVYDLDALEFAEDICYKNGLLISPGHFREFLLPYYQELFNRAHARKGRRLYLHIDTDGNPDEAIPLYLECGMDSMDPFEVAAGQDVVAKGRQYPGLVIFGGLDKRLLTDGADLSVLDRELERIIPAMRRRGGYIPTIDHGLPPDVPLQNYLHHRQRVLELDH